MKTIDLHMHSNFSDDGELTPAQLIDLAVASHIGIISITDHNSVKANAIALAYAAGKNIRYIPGTELDCQHNGLNLHLLGYAFDFTAPCFAALEQQLLEKELCAGLQRMENIRQCTTLHLDDDAVHENANGGIITGEIIAETLLADPANADAALLAPYRAGGARSDMPYVNFYWDYFSQGKPAYAHVPFISLSDAICMIHTHGGLAVLAHPGNNLKHDLGMIDALIDTGLDGIEVYSSYHSAADIAFFYEKCRSRGLLLSCGTDFHGKNKPHIALGQFAAPFDTDEIVFAQD